MWPDSPRHVTAIARVLNLNNLRALIGQIHGAERAGTILFNGKNANAG
jgi:hypothetical protein